MKKNIKVQLLFILGFLSFTMSILVADEVQKTEVVKEEVSPVADNLESQEQVKQLQKYQSMTKWLVGNKDRFQDVIKETSIETSTKWFVKEELDEKYTSASDSNESQPKVEENSVDVINTKEIIHVVAQGDTLYNVSKKYKVTTENIIKWNNLDSKQSIKLNQQLKILVPVLEKSTKENADDVYEEEDIVDPIMDIDSSVPDYKYYKVRKGDTFFSISKAHSMTRDDLLSLNMLDRSSVLSVDMILKVKSNYKSMRTNALKQDVFLWPVVGRLLIPFGPQEAGVVNEGINIAAKKGSLIRATQTGVVIYVGEELKEFGTLLLLQHESEWVSAYAHLSEVLVKKGDTVNKGDAIAKVGDSGGLSQPQLHFELRRDVKPVDPLAYLNSYR